MTTRPVREPSATLKVDRAINTESNVYSPSPPPERNQVHASLATGTAARWLSALVPVAPSCVVQYLAKDAFLGPHRWFEFDWQS